MTESWNKAIKFVLDHEGGLSENKNDPGGTTNWGISQRAYPSLDIKNLTIEQAKEIYKKDYWDKLNCDTIPSPMDIIHFDTAVNMGIKRALSFSAVSNTWQDYLFLRIEFYTKLAGAKHYLRGWTRRVLELWKLCK